MIQSDQLVRRALESYEELQSIIEQLTTEQLTHILELESQTRQRKSFTRRCIRRLVALYREDLQRRYLPPKPKPNLNQETN